MTVQSIKTNSLIEQVQQLPPLELLEIITQLLNQAWVKVPSAVKSPNCRIYQALYPTVARLQNY